jgi:hypothetical protein
MLALSATLMCGSMPGLVRWTLRAQSSPTSPNHVHQQGMKEVAHRVLSRTIWPDSTVNVGIDVALMPSTVGASGAQSASQKSFQKRAPVLVYIASSNKSSGFSTATLSESRNNSSWKEESARTIALTKNDVCTANEQIADSG